MRFRLNGWQRIGVLLSITWMIGGWIYVQSHRSAAYEASFKFAYDICSDGEQTHYSGKDCDADGQGYARLMDQGHEWDAPAVTILGVPAGWLLVYGAIALWRWVGRGFNARERGTPPV